VSESLEIAPVTVPKLSTATVGREARVAVAVAKESRMKIFFILGRGKISVMWKDGKWKLKV